MPRYYCDYCDTYLTHDSPSVRKQHNAGYKHKANVRTYYQQFEEQQTQSLIDQKVKEHLVGQTTFQQQVGVAFNQHLGSLPSTLPRPRLPVLPPPVIPVGTSSQVHPNMMPGVRPPLFPRPAPGYHMPPVVMPPGASSVSMQPNGLPGPPASSMASSAPGAPSLPSNGAPPGSNPGGYLVTPTMMGSASGGTPTSLSQTSAASSLPSHVYAAAPQPHGLPRVGPGGAAPTSVSSQDGYGYGQAPDSSHSNPAY
ncbi:U1 small nuclear ribonucleoprotein C-like [Nymphaea colorata]|nr:U1 small nuclear ribonucleoprotein C-like [Nymphaea colorata]XP_049934338.1 U1 small nuclear ribonucleoprotein C-like [Nymphaea colorata]